MRGERRTAYWMAAPALIAVLAIIVYPLAFATYYSLREVRGNLVGEFVGLANYTGIARDPAFAEALFTTLLFTAASVEGASSLQTFFKITLPLLKPAILIVLLIRLLDAFRVHDLFWVMGGRELESLSIYVYQNVLLSQINFGLGSAAAVFVFACALCVALVFAVIQETAA